MVQVGVHPNSANPDRVKGRLVDADGFVKERKEQRVTGAAITSHVAANRLQKDNAARQVAKLRGDAGEGRIRICYRLFAAGDAGFSEVDG